MAVQAQRLHERPFALKFTAPLYLGCTINPINSSSIATALVPVKVDLGLSSAQAAALVSWVYVASAVAQPAMGKVSVRFGARRTFIGGALLVALGGVLGGMAVGAAPLLAARVAIATGSSAAYPAAVGLIRRRADAHGIEVPGRVLGGLSISAQATIALGLVIGGLLVSAFGWRSIFWVNVPLAASCVVLLLRGVPRDPPSADASASQSLASAIDAGGLLLFTATMVALLAFLSDLDPQHWWQLALTLVTATALVWWERRARSPLIDVRMLARNPRLVRTYMRNLMYFVVIYTVLYGISQWMAESRGLAAVTIGLAQAPRSVLAIAGTAFASRRRDVDRLLVAAGATVAASSALMLATDRHSSVATLLVLSVLFGLTSGLGPTAVQTSMYRQAPQRDVAVAAGLLRTSSYGGAVFSAALVALVFGDRATDSGLHTLAWLFGAIGLGLTVEPLVRRRGRRAAAPTPAPLNHVER